MTTSKIIRGDSFDVMESMPENSVDAIVTDPPYGLEFMGREWDSFRVDPRSARWSGEASGGAGAGIEKAATIMGAGSDTVLPSYHRRRLTSMCRTCGKRDAFRNPHACGDRADWASIHVDQAPIEARAFQQWTAQWAELAKRVIKPGGYLVAFGGSRTHHRMIAGVEDAGFDVRDCLMWLYGQGFPKGLNISKAFERKGDLERAAEWAGWNTALKPAWEPIVLAQKPMDGPFTENVERNGVGALNIGATAIEHDEPGGRPGVFDNQDRDAKNTYGDGLGGSRFVGRTDAGRWPANVVLDEAAARELDTATGTLTSGANPKRRGAKVQQIRLGKFGAMDDAEPKRGVDVGGASRFFYTAKADDADRGPENEHPTVKPVLLMRWLIRLVAPKGGVVLDPFAGSGSTLIAGDGEFRMIGIERDPGFVDMIVRRYWPDTIEREDYARPPGPHLHVEQADAAAAGD